MAPAAEPGPKARKAAASGPERERLLRQQVVGILLVAAVILAFTLMRANWHDLFPQGWWRW
jgi:hypothetical protein